MIEISQDNLLNVWFKLRLWLKKDRIVYHRTLKGLKLNISLVIKVFDSIKLSVQSSSTDFSICKRRSVVSCEKND